MAIADILERNRRDAPDREAVVCGDVRLTYAEVGARVDRLAAVLTELGLGRGARVAVLEKNCHRFLELYFAAAQVGTVLVPLNYRLAGPELTEILADSEAGAIFVGWSFLPLLESFRDDVSRLKQIVVFADEAPDGAFAYEALLRAANGAPVPAAGSADELLYLYYTSGTTGRPKGAMLTESNIVFNARTVETNAGFTSADRYLHVAPMFHLADAGAIWSITRGGGTHVCLADFDPARCVELLERERITVTVLVPTMINFLLNSPRAASADFSAWRLLIYGASPMPETLIRRAASTFGVQLMQAYGMTELSPVVTWLSAKEHQLEGPETVVRRLRSAGRAVPGVEVRVVDDQDRDVPLGEVCDTTYRLPIVPLLQLAVPGAHALIQFLHRPDERTIPVPEGWIVAALLDQQRRHARPRWRLHRWWPARPRPELLIPECRVRRFAVGCGVERRRGDDRDRVWLQL